MLDSQLFGYRRGAFTGARDDFAGIIRSSAGGTLFLDEVGEMSLEVQPKLLRFLESGEICPVGESTPFVVNVRIVAATNSNLESLVKEGKFREDLFYRLQVMPIALPPLRERRGDIPLLASFYIDLFNREFKRHVRGVSPDALKMLEQYQWPGNIRELRNAIERAMLLVEHEWLQPGDFTTLTRSVTPAEFKLPAEGISLDEVERQLLVQALERSGGNQTQAGQLLGINRDQVRYRIEKFGLTAKS
jgi:two-component system, NtrC family, response regulator AtoC